MYAPSTKPGERIKYKYACDKKIQTERQADTQPETDRQKDKQTDRHTD